MKLDFAFVCDYAEVTGKINALGIGFETIYAPKVPTVHRLFFVVVQFRASVSETGEKKLAVHLIDDNGKDVVPPIHGNLNLPRPREGTESVGRLALEFSNVQFAAYGSYSVRVAIDGVEIADIPFKLAVAPPPKPGVGV